MQRAAVLIAAVCVALARPALPAAAQEPAVVSVSAEPARATVGDRITLTVVVEHAAGTAVEAVDPSFGQLELLATREPAVEARDGGRAATTLQFEVAAFATGTVDVPPITLRYAGPDESGELVAEPVSVTIAPVTAPDDVTLQPLKPQLEIPEAPPPPVVPAAVVAASVLFTLAGYWLVRQAIATRPAATAPPEPAGPAPDEVARRRLSALADSGLAGRDPREYYARLAVIVRRYLSDRYGFPAFAMTRSEIERGMAAAGVDRWPA
ncbi:MAG TPA: hypothetical protein VNM91_00835, partial [Dehalococcoidia bacterium]|nr:hypothetical protein [Dehalococcoidia bacterium]